MTLPIVWFVVVAFFWTGFFVLEGFDFGVGALHTLVGRTDVERRVAINTIGPVWDGNEVWLVVAGAAMFAAFPGWYASWFSALYLALWLLLAALIVRGVSFEFRGKFDTDRWRSTWSATLTVGSVLAPLLFGVGLGDLLAGLPIDADGNYTGTLPRPADPVRPVGGADPAGPVPVARRHLPGHPLHRGGPASGPVRLKPRLAVAASILVLGFAIWTYLLARPGAWRPARPGRPGARRAHRRHPDPIDTRDRPGIRRDRGRRRRHRRRPVRQPVPERAGVHHRPGEHPHRREHLVQPVLAAGDDDRRRRTRPARPGLPGLDLLRVPRPGHRPPRTLGRRGSTDTGRPGPRTATAMTAILSVRRPLSPPTRRTHPCPQQRLTDHYDVIIIGSGAGGGTLAHRLAPSGKRILILERGDWLPREVENWDATAVFVDNRYVSPDTWYDKDGKSFQPQVHYNVGGATKLYGAALYRLRERDFGELQHFDGISPAWPIDYQDFEPYYTQAEQLYQVHGSRGDDPTDPPGSAPYPFPPVSNEPRIQQLHDDLTKPGPAPLPRTLRHPAQRGRPGIQRVHPLRDLRRIPVPGARQVRRRGHRRPPRDRPPQCHPAAQRPRPTTADRRLGPHRERRARGDRRPAGTVLRRHRRRLRRRRELREAPAVQRQRPASHRDWPTARTRSAATTCSTTAARSWPCPWRRTRPDSRRPCA